MIESNNNQTSPPIQREETQAIEEIVSPVQPERRNSMLVRNIFAVLVSLALLGTTGYLLYGKPAAVKVAQAPETNSALVTAAPSSASLGAPQDQNAAVPRISSTSTTVPNMGSATGANSNSTLPTPVVAGAVTPTPSTKSYVGAGQYSIVIPSRARAVAQEDHGHVLIVYSSNGSMLGRIEITDFLLDNPSGLGDQLRLSSSITDLQSVLRSGYAGFTYKNNGLDSLALINGSRVYYITNYSGNIIQSFTLLQ